MTAAAFKLAVRDWPAWAIEEARERFCIAVEGGQQSDEKGYRVTFECVGVRLKEGKFNGKA